VFCCCKSAAPASRQATTERRIAAKIILGFVTLGLGQLKLGGLCDTP
jgi:hypothetical protein